MLNRVFRKIGIDRNEVRIANVVSCQPPNDWLDGAPYEMDAVSHCDRYLRPVLEAEHHKVAVALGSSATRRLLDLPRKKHKQQDWHGTKVWSEVFGLWVVPTFHPAFLVRGQHRLLGTVIHDVMVAQELAAGGHTPDPATTVVDPPISWFASWVEDYFEALKQGHNVWLAVDIETAETLGQDETELEDWEGQILRINFAYHPDQGVTVPYGSVYLPWIARLLSSAGVKCLWNARFDTARLRATGTPVAEPVLDFMWAWHLLQSDTPYGLGFVAPFYSGYGPWKHLSGSDPGTYAAIDAFQTLRVANGIAADLERQHQWGTFLAHVYKLDTYVLKPAEQVGLLVDKGALDDFKDDLTGKTGVLHAQIQGLVPDALKPVKLWKREPDSQLGAVAETRRELVQSCTSCGAIEVAKTHRCSDRSQVPLVSLQDRDVTRWCKTLDFNPASPDQIRAYAEAKGHHLGRAKKSKTGKGSTDKQTLAALAKTTKDPLYGKLLERREIEKVLGTYVEGTLKRLGSDHRLHPAFLHKPSTWRLSCVRPNLQNVKVDREDANGEPGVAAGFRKCLVAAPGCVLIEADFSGIEAVETGWFSNDPSYIRLAKLGVHSYLASYLVGRPADLKWSDADLGKHFKFIKTNFKADYERAKRCVHGSNYGLTAIGMVNNYPEIFTRGSAQKTQELYFSVCPKLAPWQKHVRQQAFKQHYLGGDEHPFHYKHWFWSVFTWSSTRKVWVNGEDAKKVVAYYPQSTAAGVLKAACLRLLDDTNSSYIGHLYYGATPLRALVHDSIVLEVPEKAQDEAIEKLVMEMTRPIVEQPNPAAWGLGSHLTIGVAVKVGKSWAPANKSNPLGMTEVDLGEVGVASDTAVFDPDDDEEAAA